MKKAQLALLGSHHSLGELTRAAARRPGHDRLVGEQFGFPLCTAPARAIQVLISWPPEPASLLISSCCMRSIVLVAGDQIVQETFCRREC